MKTVIHKPELQRIDFLDDRFYFNGERYLPSVTTILDVYPKGYGFLQWAKDMGANADEVLQRAGELGSNVHNGIDLLNKGIELSWTNSEGFPAYSLIEWEMILKFKDFIDKSGAKVMHNEFTLASDSLGYAGTIDMICNINGKVVLMDVKTSNGIYKTHELQVSAYAKMYETETSLPIDYTAILWLRASTRTEKIDHDKCIYQGKGWQLKTFDRSHKESYRLFNYAHEIWKEENQDAKPKNLIYPDKIKL